MARIVLDNAKCVALGVCESIAPKYFELNDHGGVDLICGVEVDPEDIEVVREAVLGCPTEALVLEED